MQVPSSPVPRAKRRVTSLQLPEEPPDPDDEVLGVELVELEAAGVDEEDAAETESDVEESVVEDPESDPSDPSDPKEPREEPDEEPLEPRDPRDPRDPKEPKPLEPLELPPKDPRDPNEPREDPDEEPLLDPREPREPRDPKEPRPLEPLEPPPKEPRLNCRLLIVRSTGAAAAEMARVRNTAEFFILIGWLLVC
ncbi:uncharacterized protein RCC_08420 [Ramularia collo-cygni]|uniref:Uncharacterized protein n=1 Tax=Ramularia collo-cygni TaxID=112498 RepID=A0A2D3VAQ2_9PEZI|nr:uncharacterized protein RCC_08420 [Ramularia collo-cygni]CZT22715.1 uncharacterized protein RCC_08420 [Ramularia collo-cygni]